MRAENQQVRNRSLSAPLASAAPEKATGQVSQRLAALTEWRPAEAGALSPAAHQSGDKTDGSLN